MEKVIEKLKALAAEEAYSESEDFCPMDRYGGNFDDAFRGGMGDGEIFLAREILAMLGEK